MVFKQWKRLAAGILSAAIVLSGIPAQASAGTAVGTGTTEETGTPTEEIGTTTPEVSKNTEETTGQSDQGTEQETKEGTEPAAEEGSNQNGLPNLGEEKEEKEEKKGAEEDGSFILAVFTKNQTVVEPMTVDYQAGDTLKDALSKSGIEFGGLDSGFIQSVNGVSGSYSMAFADGSYGLDTAADQVGTFFLSERTDVNREHPEEEADDLVAAVSQALREMAAYREAENSVQNYPSAQTAYQSLLTSMRTGDKDTLKAKTEALTQAVKDYESYLESGKRKVTVHVTQGGQEVTDAQLSFTDEYGNVTEGTGTEIELRDGTYTFVVTDSHNPYNHTTNVGKMNGIAGKFTEVKNYFTVSETSTDVSVKLASGEWFEKITTTAGADVNGSKALDTTRTKYDAENHKAVMYVADNFSGMFKTTIQKTNDTPAKDKSGTQSSINIVPWVDWVYATGANQGKRVSDIATTSLTTRTASFDRPKTCLNFLDYGMQGNQLDLAIRWLDDTESDKTGCIVEQSFDVEVKRYPTLQSLELKDSTGASLLGSFDPYQASYEITSTDDSFTLEAVPYAADYTVSYKAGENTTVSGDKVTLSGDTGTVTAVVEAEGITNSYTITLHKVSPVDVTLKMDAGVTAEVYNESGSKLEPKTEGGTVYALVPGATYSYVGTSKEHYHTTATFTAEENQVVQVAAPEEKQVLTAFDTYDKPSYRTRIAYKWEKAFAAGTYEYTIQVPDANGSFYVQATKSDSGYSYYTRYKTQTRTTDKGDVQKDWTSTTINEVNAETNASRIADMVASSGQSNVLELQLRKTVDGVTYYQEYSFLLVRTLHLSELQASVNTAEALPLLDAEGNSQSFDRDITDYTVKVSGDTQEIKLSMTFPNENDVYSYDGGYSVWVNGTLYDSGKDITVPLEMEQERQTISIQVCHRDTNAISTTYRLTVQKQQPVKVTFQTTPEHATVFVTNQLNQKNVYADDKGVFSMMPEVPYTYIISAPGYKAVQQTDFKLETSDGPEKTITVDLEKAPDPEKALPDYTSEWPTFRADFNGNGVVSAKTPTSAEESVLYWANKIGDGYGSNASGCPILVNGYLYTYAGDQILKVDTVSGEVVDHAQMAAKSSFAINSPTYADGMIFVGLSDGRIQAFNAETLESLWVYQDPLGGQPNCSIKYQDGYIYTGFWLGETKQANFVCISVTDEDPTNPTEEKVASWRYTHNGFYWAGAYASKKFVLVGTDDGASGYTTGHASVLSFDPVSGKLLDEKVLPGVGDLRSDIMYDEKGTGDYYFTTKGGDFYRLSVNADGTFGTLQKLKLSNYAEDPSNPAMSTCTPVVYNGRAYIGVSGTGQFEPYSGHNITVIDLDSWSIAYKVRTQGYPQTSGLLTTAYEDETGLVYVYFVDNFTPGKVRVISDKKGQTEPNEVTQEEGYDTAPVLFTPSGAQAQYAICSPIADENGFLYFKNDSAYMMCVGPTIEKIEVTKQPDKTSYKVGETFDGTGMVVTATYSNGTTKDITKYVTYSQEPLKESDTDFLVEFSHVMYQDKDGQTGVEYTAPTAHIQLTFNTGEETKNPDEPKTNPDEPKTTPEDTKKNPEEKSDTEKKEEAVTPGTKNDTTGGSSSGQSTGTTSSSSGQSTSDANSSSTSSASSAQQTESAATGDSTVIWLPICLLAGASLGIGMIWKKKKEE